MKPLKKKVFQYFFVLFDLSKLNVSVIYILRKKMKKYIQIKKKTIQMKFCRSYAVSVSIL